MEEQETTALEALQSKLGQLENELSYLNKILIDCGFEQGIATLKATAEEMISTLM